MVSFCSPSAGLMGDTMRAPRTCLYCLFLTFPGASLLQADPVLSPTEAARYLYGIGVERNPQKAFSALQEAAKKGNARAHMLLNKCYQFGFDAVQCDEKLALDHLKLAATAGDAVAQYCLADAMQDGRGVPKEPRQAELLLARSIPVVLDLAAKGDMEAQLACGMAAWYGSGMSRDLEKAAGWFQKAADQGHPTARIKLTALADLHHNPKLDKKQVFELIKLAAEQGHVAAQTEIGWYYRSGSGVEKDDKLAVLWYRKAAMQGFPPAQVNLGFSYYQGEGEKLDQAVSFRWFRRAAAGGDEKGQLMLGYQLLHGEGVKQDEREAVKWLMLAAEKGNADAIYLVGYCKFEGRGVAKNEVGGALDFKKAAEMGHKNAQYNLGLCYLKGMGLLPDITEGKNWLQKAATQGHQKAQEVLDRLATMPPE